MKEQNFKDEVTKILEEAPSARKALLENYDNLMNVADYCCNNYLQSEDGRLKALEETKNFTAQSLASVAYQISTLANSVLSLLNAQTNQLLHMESSINLVGQMVEMHKEKVSRREIGGFTVVRRVPRNHKIIPPAQSAGGSQPRPLYSRQPINFQQLDGLGHSMKISGKQADKSGPSRKHGFSTRSIKPPEAVQCPVAPPVSSSFGKPVALPTVPTTWQPPPDGDIITTLLDEAPPPPPPSPTLTETSSQDNQCANDLAPPPPPEAVQNHSTAPPAPPLALPTAPPPAPPQALPTAPPPAPPTAPPPAPSLALPTAPPPAPPLAPPLDPLPAPPLESLPAPPLDPLPAPPLESLPAPPLSLETGKDSCCSDWWISCADCNTPNEHVVEENSFPAPPPPPLSDDDAFPSLTNDGLELLVPPPPCQDADVTVQSRRGRRRLPAHSLSLRVRSGPASRCRYSCSLMIPPPPPYPPPLAPPLPPPSSLALLPRSSSSSSSSPRLCLPARLEHLALELPAPPPPPLLDDESGFDDIMMPLPPPEYDNTAPDQYLEKVVALYSYEASKPDDLSFTEGDVLYLTHRHDDGWCEGALRGKRGFFPGNYVQSNV